MPVDVYSLENLVAGCMIFSLRGDDRNDVSCVTQRACLTPDAPIKRHRKIFDNDADSSCSVLSLYVQIGLFAGGIHIQSLLRFDAPKSFGSSESISSCGS